MVVIPEGSRVELELTGGPRTMSGLIEDLTSQTFILQVMLTGHIGSYCTLEEL